MEHEAGLCCARNLGQLMAGFGCVCDVGDMEVELGQWVVYLQLWWCWWLWCVVVVSVFVSVIRYLYLELRVAHVDFYGQTKKTPAAPLADTTVFGLSSIIFVVVVHLILAM